MPAAPPDLADLARGVAVRPPVLLTGPGLAAAAVAIVLAPSERGLTLLLIERAAREDDPWSGHIAFPGGKAEPDDPDHDATARRETLEEVGLDLADARLLGRLDDRHGFTRPIAVASLVYVVAGPGMVWPAGEVRQVSWVPLAHLFDPARQDRIRVGWGGREFGLPAVRILPPPAAPLWGLTYRLLESLWARCDRAFPVAGIEALRAERAGEEAAVAAVERAAFGRPDEARLVDRLRGDGLLLQSLVALDGVGVVGHVAASRAHVATARDAVAVAALAPVAVAPRAQGQGLGGALVRRVLDELRVARERIVVVLGDPAYYVRFGFEPAAARGLTCAFTDSEAFQVLELEPGALRGVAGPVRYAPAFDGV